MENYIDITANMETKKINDCDIVVNVNETEKSEHIVCHDAVVELFVVFVVFVVSLVPS